MVDSIYMYTVIHNRVTSLPLLYEKYSAYTYTSCCMCVYMSINVHVHVHNACKLAHNMYMCWVCMHMISYMCA